MNEKEIIGRRRWNLKRKYKTNKDDEGKKKQGTGGQKSCRAVIDLDSSQIKVNFCGFLIVRPESKSLNK